MTIQPSLCFYNQDFVIFILLPILETKTNYHDFVWRRPMHQAAAATCLMMVKQWYQQQVKPCLSECRLVHLQVTFRSAMSEDGRNAAKLPSSISGFPQIACPVSQQYEHFPWKQKLFAGDTKKVLRMSPSVTSQISVVMLRTRPTTGIARRNPSILDRTIYGSQKLFSYCAQDLSNYRLCNFTTDKNIELLTSN